MNNAWKRAARALALPAVVAMTGLLGCGNGGGGGSDGGAEAAAPDVSGGSGGTVQHCVVLGETCSEFRNVPPGDVAAICSSATVLDAPCPTANRIGGCRRDYTVGTYTVWSYNDGTGLQTEATVRSSCAEGSSPGTFVAP